ncbi:hypothetical protein [Microbacterium sp. Marseille-Q6648]|uniref:hypothetical protein n=1 Tax=Microbacterium sp. Marseille-Q6648 TaxID=2937991 RepID=UPI002041D561|nr:hypothetical protein [Microbacterium sp. Marseille-Q6648]
MSAHPAYLTFELAERSDGFNYDYRMRCACGETSALAADDYLAEARSARMNCAHCGREIHFGRAVAALREENDPALQDNLVSTFAWYHTSTSPDWPSPDYAAQFENQLKWVERDFGISRDNYLARQTSKALHVGTYEAGIENMLRRMEYQNDGTKQFYLYRVALRLTPGRISAGYRDENHAVASDISVAEISDAGLDAVRYLNVHEAMGTLSLAVVPSAIAAVQCIPIPIATSEVITDDQPAAVRATVEDVRNATRKLRTAEEALSSIEPRVQRMMVLGMRPDPDGAAKRIGKLEQKYYRTWHDLQERLATEYLPNVSAVIRRDFNDAVAGWRDENAEVFVQRYRPLASLLERPSEAIAEVSTQAWRFVGGAQASL